MSTVSHVVPARWLLADRPFVLGRHLEQDGPGEADPVVPGLQRSHGDVGVRGPLPVERVRSSPHLHPGGRLCVSSAAAPRRGTFPPL